jgi:hypothetical protein
MSGADGLQQAEFQVTGFQVTGAGCRVPARGGGQGESEGRPGRGRDPVFGGQR